MISVVIVNWNSGLFLERCVLSLMKHADDCEIIIVDNASEDFSLDFTRRLDAPLSLLRNRENLGFAAGSNRGWRKSAGEQVLFLNPDTECMPGSVHRLARLLMEDPTIWAAGGRLVSRSGRLQAGFNVRAFPSVKSVAAEMLLLEELWPGNSWTRNYRMSYWDHASAQEVDQPAAACLMVQRLALEYLSGFDESFRPAWFEDVDLCRRIWGSGGRIFYEPAAEFVHAGGSSLNHLAKEQFLKCFHTNQLRYFRKHHSERDAERVLRLICAGLYLRAALSLVRPVIRGSTRAWSARTFWRTARHFAGLREISP